MAKRIIWSINAKTDLRDILELEQRINLRLLTLFLPHKLIIISILDVGEIQS
jgi:hypothetical protein